MLTTFAGCAITVVPTQRYTGERALRAYMVDLRKPSSNLQKARVANASMLMTYDRKRVVSRAGRISAEAERALDQALALHLGLASP
ncbi:MAG: type II toxin-antitoxin system PemK/MazF family toxin [Vicinamibacteria bacterium]|nr:type II toxin-antitoxin system PemK/MazF family toxin [Vicinamibacteria bacterium]